MTHQSLAPLLFLFEIVLFICFLLFKSIVCSVESWHNVLLVSETVTVFLNFTIDTPSKDDVFVESSDRVLKFSDDLIRQVSLKLMILYQQ